MPDFSLTQMAFAPSEKPSHSKLNNILWVAELQRRQNGPYSFSVSDITASSLKMTITDYWEDIGGYVTTGGNDWLAKKFAVEYRQVQGGGTGYARWEDLQLSWDATEDGWSTTLQESNKTIAYQDGGTTRDALLGTGTGEINLENASGLNFTVWSMNNQG